MTNHRISIIAFIYLLVLTGCKACEDRVVLLNATEDEHGILVDGIRAGKEVNDSTFVFKGSGQYISNFRLSTVSNEVIAFAKGRPMAIHTGVPWTDGTDRDTLTFADNFELPITIWIVKGPYDTQEDKALLSVAEANAIFLEERMGVTLVPNVKNAIPDTFDFFFSPLYEFDCAEKEALKSVGYIPGQINVYYVGTVVEAGTGAYVTNAGNGCGEAGFIVMGENTGTNLLVHEVGHKFGLGHTNLLSDFDNTNVMHSSSSVRAYFTEGQVFRAHIHIPSDINTVYNARPGQITRNCFESVANATCIPLKKRIWADGIFPAN